MTERIRILIVDDHQMVRAGLRTMLELEPDFEVVGEVGDPRQALASVNELDPEIVLMDIKMPEMSGIELTRLLKEKRPDCSIVILTLYDEYLTQAIEAGADGYLQKDIKREELVRAIRAAHEGRSPLNLSLGQDRLAALAAAREGQGPALSERELAVLRLVASGASTTDIAEQLFLSQSSVKRSVAVIFEKLGVHNRSEAVSEAHKRNLI